LSILHQKAGNSGTQETNTKDFLLYDLINLSEFLTVTRYKRIILKSDRKF